MKCIIFFKGGGNNPSIIQQKQQVELVPPEGCGADEDEPDKDSSDVSLCA